MDLLSAWIYQAVFRASPTASTHFFREGEWTVIFSFYILTFLNILLTDFLSHSQSHLNIISSFIIYHHLFFLYLFSTIIFFNEKYYIYNIFYNTFSTKFMWKVVINSNLNSPLKLFFFSPILTNNNLLLKIYCENIVVKFLD